MKATIHVMFVVIRTGKAGDSIMRIMKSMLMITRHGMVEEVVVMNVSYSSLICRSCRLSVIIVIFVIIDIIK
jgi:hypothetical protein